MDKRVHILMDKKKYKELKALCKKLGDISVSAFVRTEVYKAMREYKKEGIE